MKWEADMDDFITLTCKSCGGKLQITPEIDDFACMYCGTEYRVKREGGIVALTPIVEELKKVSVSTDKTASELAIVRLKEEISTSYKNLNENNELYEKLEFEKGEDLESLKDRGRAYKFALFGTIFIVFLILFNLIFTGLFNLSENWAAIFSLLISPIIFYLILINNPNDIFNKEKIQILEIEIKKMETDHNNYKIELEKIIKNKNSEIMKHQEIVGSG